MPPIRILSQLMILLIIGALLYSCSSDSPSSSTDSSTTEASNQPEFVYANYPQAELLQKYLKAYPDNLTEAAPANAVELRAAMAAYNAGQYQAAIDTFPNFSRRVELIGYIHLYKGIAYLMAGKEHDAFMTFQLIRSNQLPAFEISEWYRAVCYLAYNNTYEARRKLESIVKKGNYGKEDAAELLELLPEK